METQVRVHKALLKEKQSRGHTLLSGWKPTTYITCPATQD